MSIRRWLALLSVPAITLGLALTAAPAVASTASPAKSHHPSGTEIVLAHTAFGWSLAVGSGPFKGFTLYFISSDHPPSYGCTTVPISLPGAPPGFTCTGPSNDQNAEWPAITSNNGRPVAGPGVIQALLGRVYRKHVGWQVTYAGYPLYLFDQGPGQVTGQGWFEPGLPPWHGIWWLMAADGQPLPWAGTVTTTTIGGQRVLAESYLTHLGWINFPVYTFSGDSYGPRCSLIPACRRAWPPVLTGGTPGSIGVPAADIGGVGIPFGLTQTTWNGSPLYLFAFEQLAPTANGGAAPVGNGNGINAFGGTFSLVPVP
jgi:predicted lipoprotein with Yx(FWY)xxD motif